MGTPPIAFDRKGQFVKWIRDSRREVGDGVTLFVGYDSLAWTLLALLDRSEQMPSWADRSFPIPRSARDSEEIWNSVHEEHLCLFFRFDSLLHGIIVAARNGAWQSLEDKYLSRKKAEFVEISCEQARETVKSSLTWSQICGEVQEFGLSCRVFQKDS